MNWCGSRSVGHFIHTNQTHQQTVLFIISPYLDNFGTTSNISTNCLQGGRIPPHPTCRNSMCNSLVVCNPDQLFQGICQGELATLKVLIACGVYNKQASRCKGRSRLGFCHFYCKMEYSGELKWQKTVLNETVTVLRHAVTGFLNYRWGNFD